MRTEAETILELERLLDALDDAARKRAVDWVEAKYTKAPPAPAATPPTFVPLPYPVPAAPAPVIPYVPGWPSAPNWPGDKIIVTCETKSKESALVKLALQMLESEQARLTMTGSSLGGGVVFDDARMWIGPGLMPVDGLVFRS